ncbi:hypothetical protein M3795_25395 [Ralstonia pickettii]|jgi:hypothetical protein|uniref:hypothetical protein n=1 Tax=Ralstonia TaxID=48736 RepID=UPI00203ABA88|nr:hypothetical protein [Ralstonia pickettii]MCM3583810.1 hypothetical protein [Ralstonia pickettii]
MAQGHLDLGIPTEAVALTRDVHGFKQFREDAYSPWRFYVTGFDHTSWGESGYCWVLTSGNSKERVPIDARNRISIGGKKYSDKFWSH